MEPSGLLNPTNEPLKRKQHDSSESRPPKSINVDHDDDTLCESCDKVDFFALFTSNCKRTELGPLSYALSYPRCPFCSYIAGIVRHKHNDLVHSGNGTLILMRSFLHLEEYIKKSGVEVFYRLDVWIELNVQNRLLLTTIEMCDGLPELVPNVRMMRVPMKARFDPSLLLEWLRQTRQKEPSTKSRHLAQSISSAKSLRDRGRLRALDVHSGRVVVLRTEERYLALSYVWGPYAEHRKRIVHRPSQDSADRVAWTVNLSLEPATIRDAVCLVRELGERYLWVDSLCIDHEDAMDMAEIVSNMDIIYQFAYLTIVGADGENAHAGLKRLHTHASYPEQSVTFGSRGRCLSFLSKAPQYDSTLPQTVWSTRGWTYQELSLSPRAVVFTEDQVFYFAMGMREQESYRFREVSDEHKDTPGNARGWRIAKELTTREFLATKNTQTYFYHRIAYTKAVVEYTKRTLTYEEDRFDAFHGILSSFGSCFTIQQRRHAHALSGGIPMSISDRHQYDFAFDWDIRGPSHRIPRTKMNGRLLPSWSWTGWSGAVEFSHPLATFHKLVVMNENNVKVDLECLEGPYVNQKFNPKPCELTPKEDIVLHMWAPYLQCRLVERDKRHKDDIPDTHCLYSVMVASGYGYERAVGTIILDEALRLSVDAHTLHEFIGLEGESLDLGYHGRLLLVKRCEHRDFVERIGISFNKVSLQRRHRMGYRYIKLH